MEMSTIAATKDVEKKGMSGDGDTNTGGVGECGENGETMLEVCQTQDGVHRAQQQSTM